MRNVAVVVSLALMTVLIGCAPAYIPNAVNVPLLGNQAEFHGSFSAGTSGTDFQTSYALTGNLGLMANYSFYKGTFGTESSNTDYTVIDNTKRSFLEGGVGYYTALSKNGRFETYGGYGQGTSTSNTYDLFGPQDLIATGSYRRFFIQPSIGTTSDNFDAALSLRTCYVNFYRIQSGELLLDHNVDGFFIEPVLTTRLGYEHVKLFAQVGFSLPSGQVDLEMFFQPFLFNLGLIFNIGKKPNIAGNK